MDKRGEDEADEDALQVLARGETRRRVWAHWVAVLLLVVWVRSVLRHIRIQQTSEQGVGGDAGGGKNTLRRVNRRKSCA